MVCEGSSVPETDRLVAPNPGESSSKSWLWSLTLAEFRGACNASEGTQSGLDGWWGKNSSRLSSVAQCRLEDYPAGLHWLKHRYPPNWNQPDEVEIIRRTSLNFQFSLLFERENKAGGVYSAVLKGFFHPLGATSSDRKRLNVTLVSSAAHAWLYMSRDDQPSQKVCTPVK